MDAVLAIKITIGVMGLFGLYFYLSQPAYDGGPTRWTRWKAALDAWRLSSVSGGETAPSVESSAQTSRQTTQTDQQTARPSALPSKPPRLAVDRTRQAVMEELLTLGWTTADLRREGILRGDNATIGQEVAETRKRLGLVDPERTIKVRDERGEREIVLDAK